MSIGIPLKLLHEAKNHIIHIEVKTGDTYWGYLIDMDDTMNTYLEKV